MGNLFDTDDKMDRVKHLDVLRDNNPELSVYIQGILRRTMTWNIIKLLLMDCFNVVNLTNWIYHPGRAVGSAYNLNPLAYGNEI